MHFLANYCMQKFDFFYLQAHPEMHSVNTKESEEEKKRKFYLTFSRYNLEKLI